ncbi:hypothetical protein GQX74_001942 [Glossina fuscipes]|nr:hypothetical protein GQX74_001942 [Glossina fuscipes]
MNGNPCSGGNMVGYILTNDNDDDDDDDDDDNGQRNKAVGNLRKILHYIEIAPAKDMKHFLSKFVSMHISSANHHQPSPSDGIYPFPFMSLFVFMNANHLSVLT